MPVRICPPPNVLLEGKNTRLYTRCKFPIPEMWVHLAIKKTLRLDIGHRALQTVTGYQKHFPVSVRDEQDNSVVVLFRSHSPQAADFYRRLHERFALCGLHYYHCYFIRCFCLVRGEQRLQTLFLLRGKNTRCVCHESVIRWNLKCNRLQRQKSYCQEEQNIHWTMECNAHG